MSRISTERRDPRARDIWTFPLRLARHAFSPREAARAGEVWRLVQEAAVEGSTLAGWPPSRYRVSGTGFVVRRMRVVHHREAVYGEHLTASTWVTSIKRGMLTTREVRLNGEDGPVAGASTDWVHVNASLTPTRASTEMVDAFPVRPSTPADGVVHVPKTDRVEPGRPRSFGFSAWHTWMDPLAHANHPAYVDWADEATCRGMVAAGLDPQQLCPVAEEVTFRQGVVAPEEVLVETTRQGTTGAGSVVLRHRVLRRGVDVAAEVTTVRRLADGDPARLSAAFD